MGKMFHFIKEFHGSGGGLATIQMQMPDGALSNGAVVVFGMPPPPMETPVWSLAHFKATIDCAVRSGRVLEWGHYVCNAVWQFPMSCTAEKPMEGTTDTDALG